MSLVVIASIFVTTLVLGYRFYGRYIERNFRINDQTKTPAHTLRDGQDFEPTRPFYLFGQHFSAIAAAGPIAGPIAACLLFGWVPCLLWIGLGVVFIGAVHDFSSLTASVRHGACSIAEIARKVIGTRAGAAMLLFIWIALVYIIVAFTDITVSAFVSVTEELEGVSVPFHTGGAVAAASVLYLGLALLLGIVQRFLKPPLLVVTLIFIPLTFVTTWAGTWFSYSFVATPTFWTSAILVYCAIASVLPVWSLLQPRGYLGGFVLYFALAAGLVGVLFGGYAIEQPAFKGFDVGGPTGNLFPFLFVTIACGACSGFHGLVCSGTTSKQVDRETHLRPVGYGAMLAEGLVAFLALVVVMVATPAEVKGLKPGTIYGNGIGKFLSLIVGKENLPLAITFGAMAFSTFVFDTLDVSARLGRYILQELTGWRTRLGSVVGTVVTVAAPGIILLYGGEGSWTKFWTLFGASNQLLAGLTLLITVVWLKSQKRKLKATVLPMIFVFLITVVALVLQIRENIKLDFAQSPVGWFNAGAALTLLLLAGYISTLAVARLFPKRFKN